MSNDHNPSLVPPQHAEIVKFEFPSGTNGHDEPASVEKRVVFLEFAGLLSKDAIICARIPLAGDTSGIETTECVLSKLSYDRITNHPEFNPWSKIPPEGNTAKVVKQDGGSGLFAKRDFPNIKVGEVVLSETAMVIIPKPSIIAESSSLENASKLTDLQIRQALSDLAVSRLSPDNRRFVMALPLATNSENPRPQFNLGRLMDRYGLVVYGLQCTAQLSGIADSYLALFKNMSLINRSCTPNCTGPIFDPHSFSHSIIATLDINPGDEITLQILNPILVPELAKRQKSFRRKGFTCGCTLCRCPDDSAESDLRTLQQKEKLLSRISSAGDKEKYDISKSAMEKMERLELDGSRTYYHFMRSCYAAGRSVLKSKSAGKQELQDIKTHMNIIQRKLRGYDLAFKRKA